MGSSLLMCLFALWSLVLSLALARMCRLLKIMDVVQREDESGAFAKEHVWAVETEVGSPGDHGYKPFLQSLLVQTEEVWVWVQRHL